MSRPWWLEGEWPEWCGEGRCLTGRSVHLSLVPPLPPLYITEAATSLKQRVTLCTKALLYLPLNVTRYGEYIILNIVLYFQILKLLKFGLYSKISTIRFVYGDDLAAPLFLPSPPQGSVHSCFTIVTLLLPLPFRLPPAAVQHYISISNPVSINLTL